jgi:hypothetical protein
MALIKETKIDQITFDKKSNVFFYRENITIIDNGVQIAQTYHRSSVTPTSDLTSIPAEVAELCAVKWTPEVVAAYKDSQNDNVNT